MKVLLAKDLRAHRGQPQLIRQMQRSLGNRSVQRMLSLARSGEGEADVSPEVESSIERSRGGGQALDKGTRGQMESAFGVDFGGVRIHTGAQSHSLNRSVSAVAFTTGSDISYDPSSNSGKKLLAHELTHVVQQGGAAEVSGVAQRFAIQRMCPACENEEKKIQGKLVLGSPGDQYEQEADQVAERVVSAHGAGGTERIRSADAASTASLLRQDDDNNQGTGSTEVAVDQDMPQPDEDPAESVSASSPEPRISRMCSSCGKEHEDHAGVNVGPVHPHAPGVYVQRWHSDGPAPGNTNTIVCDGHGGVRVQTGGTGDATQTRCLSDCIRQHEGSHRDDALAANPRICDGQTDGTQVTFNGEQRASEIKASNVEIACLRAKLPSAGDCRDTINARITQITAYRDSF
jgi:hypothetical protein